MAKNKDKLLKAGELARQTGLLVSTVRFYTKIGLLKADAVTPGNYNLYEERRAVKRLNRIDQLKKQRWTLDEILKKVGAIPSRDKRAE